ncbi:MAG: PD-(D/E)XK nuclease family protein [Candidatus Gastranaerophilales bacterium]|nr:PD-(D/E)XK nuclease family protein [Candidatus Gastranaerophilales bacterium]
MLNNFSANMLKTFKKCPKKFELIYENNIKIPSKSQAAEQGKNIHSLINYYLQNKDISKFVEILTSTEKELWENFLTQKIQPNDTLHTEYPFNVKLGNFWLTGRIDAIIKKDNEYIIYDWKTGSIPENAKSDLQTAIYLYAINEILKDLNPYNHCILSFIYVNLKNKTTEVIQTDDFLIDGYKSKITGIVESVRDKKHRKKSTTSTCKNCDLKNLC